MKLFMLFALLAIVGALVLSLIHRHRSALSLINLEDLLLGDDGRISKAAAVMLGAFALTTWVIAYLTVNDKLTEGYFVAYLGAWVAPTVTRLIVARAPTSTSPGAQLSTPAPSSTASLGASL